MGLNSSNLDVMSEILKILFNTLPYVFWKNTRGVYLGGNQNQALNMGFKSPQEFIGKTIYEILSDQEAARAIDEADTRVMNDNRTLVTEERIKTSKGEKVYLSQKSPIHNEQGFVIGMIGFAMDITEIKQYEEQAKKERDGYRERAIQEEKARLTQEIKARTEQLEAQAQFTHTANQMAHDIRSPLASLKMIVKACEAIPERERIALRAASSRINDIANNLLLQYRDNTDLLMQFSKPLALLISAAMLQLITEKKFQYQEQGVRFEFECDLNGQFAFIIIEPSSFKRMLSNLINNAVEACIERTSHIRLHLNATTEAVSISVIDNGKGMSRKLIEKILKSQPFSEGKLLGFGMGMSQVQETLTQNNGSLAIKSELNQGTEIKLTFPKAKAPVWIADKINITSNDIVVILDDDHSIHGAWDSRFESVQGSGSLQLHHFEQGEAALNFLTQCSSEDKARILLLTDYELLQQPINGLDVVEQTHLKRVFLVTSHYESVDIQERARSLNVKIIPKQLAAEIPIKYAKLPEKPPKRKEETPIHAILIDDDKDFIDDVLCYVFDEGDRIQHFTSPEEFMNFFKKNPDPHLKNTKICLDNNFDTSKMKGLTLAQELHSLGFTQLYLISGENIHVSDIPDYVRVLSKSDIGSIKDW